MVKYINCSYNKNKINIRKYNKMNVSKTMSMNSGRLGGSMYESESQRLQREADNFTKKFEHEKK